MLNTGMRFMQLNLGWIKRVLGLSKKKHGFFKKALTGATAEALTSDTTILARNICDVWFQLPTAVANTGDMYIGDSSVTATTDYPIILSNQDWPQYPDISELYVIGTSGDEVTVTYTYYDD